MSLGQMSHKQIATWTKYYLLDAIIRCPLSRQFFHLNKYHLDKCPLDKSYLANHAAQPSLIIRNTYFLLFLLWGRVWRTQMQLKLENVAGAWESKRVLQLAEPRGRPGYIGSADEQAHQFLQERRMDGDVKIPIWNAFFWAYWNILWYYKASLKTSLISSFSPNTQSCMQNSTLKKKRKNWVLISIYYFKVPWTEEVVWLSRDDFLFTICTDFCERDGLLPKPVNKPLVWLNVYSQHGSCEQSYFGWALHLPIEEKNSPDL